MDEILNFECRGCYRNCRLELKSNDKNFLPFACPASRKIFIACQWKKIEEIDYSDRIYQDMVINDWLED